MCGPDSELLTTMLDLGSSRLGLGLWELFFYPIILGAALQILRNAILSTSLPVEQAVLFVSASSWARVEGLYQTLPSEVRLQTRVS